MGCASAAGAKSGRQWASARWVFDAKHTCCMSRGLHCTDVVHQQCGRMGLARGCLNMLMESKYAHGMQANPTYMLKYCRPACKASLVSFHMMLNYRSCTLAPTRYLYGFQPAIGSLRRRCCGSLRCAIRMRRRRMRMQRLIRLMRQRRPEEEHCLAAQLGGEV